MCNWPYVIDNLFNPLEASQSLFNRLRKCIDTLMWGGGGGIICNALKRSIPVPPSFKYHDFFNIEWSIPNICIIYVLFYIPCVYVLSYLCSIVVTDFKLLIYTQLASFVNNKVHLFQSHIC